jgi:hypothetical protein
MMSGPDLKKKREILFSKFPPGQVPEAADDLKHLDEVDVDPKYEKRSVGVSYELTNHTLRELDEHLVDKGFHLDNTLMSKLTPGTHLLRRRHPVTQHGCTRAPHEALLTGSLWQSLGATPTRRPR